MLTNFCTMLFILSVCVLFHSLLRLWLSTTKIADDVHDSSYFARGWVLYQHTKYLSISVSISVSSYTYTAIYTLCTLLKFTRYVLVASEIEFLWWWCFFFNQAYIFFSFTVRRIPTSHHVCFMSQTCCWTHKAISFLADKKILVQKISKFGVFVYYELKLPFDISVHSNK
jgi:hypothetical protein